MFDCQKNFQMILQELKKGSRPQIKLTQEEIDQLNKQMGEAIETLKDMTQVEQVLCILEFSRPLSDKYLANLLKLMNKKDLPQEILIHLLMVTHKHIIQLYQQKGEKLPREYRQRIQEMLYEYKDEGLLWVVKTVDAMGAQGRMFYNDLQKIQPRGLFHWKAQTRELKTLIQQIIKN